MHFTKTNTSIFFQNKPLKNEGPTKWDQFNVPPPPFTTESDFLKNFCLKTHIAWGNSIDERWTHKLHMCATLAETVSLLQESIYTEAVNISGHLKPKKRNLAGQSR